MKFDNDIQAARYIWEVLTKINIMDDDALKLLLGVNSKEDLAQAADLRTPFEIAFGADSFEMVKRGALYAEVAFGNATFVCQQGVVWFEEEMVAVFELTEPGIYTFYYTGILGENLECSIEIPAE